MLYIVATPIGNLKDITLRALEILKEVDLIVCEDTRVTRKLLAHYGISKPLVSYFQHSRLSKVNYIIGKLRQGKSIALVTDAGTPGISDPGGLLVDNLISLQVNKLEKLQIQKEKNFPTYQPTNLQTKIVPMPGPCALTAALSVSGFPADRFVFVGFPPAKKGRQKFFEEIIKLKYTVVLYESCHRILRSLRDLQSIFSNPSRIKSNESRMVQQNSPQAFEKDSVYSRGIREKQIVVCRELTKKFETIYRGTVDEVIKELEKDKNNLKGEFVVIISK